MSFAIARGIELREALDKPVGVPLPPERDIALLRDAVEKWIEARRDHLDALLDLLKEPDAKPQADVWKKRIDTFKDDTFYANIFMHVDHAQVVADARPSDAIALALKVQAPIRSRTT